MTTKDITDDGPLAVLMRERHKRVKALLRAAGLTLKEFQSWPAEQRGAFIRSGETRG